MNRDTDYIHSPTAQLTIAQSANAIRKGHYKLAMNLLTNEPLLAQASHEGAPLISLASATRHLPLYTMLINAGADPFAVDAQGVCAFSLLLQNFTHEKVLMVGYALQQPHTQEKLLQALRGERGMLHALAKMMETDSVPLAERHKVFEAVMRELPQDALREAAAEVLNGRPLICHAVSAGDMELYAKMLAAGADPFAEDGQGLSASSLILRKPFTPENAGLIQSLLKHPLCTPEKMARAVNGERGPLHALVGMLEEDIPGKLHTARYKTFREILQQLPEELIAHAVFSPFLTSKIQERDIIWAARELVNSGMDLNRLPPDGTDPLSLCGVRTGLAGALLTAGLDKYGRIYGPEPQEKTNDYTLPRKGEDRRLYFKRMLGYTNNRDPRSEILADYQKFLLRKNTTPQALLLTPQGRATWQAQGLALNDKLQALFEPQYAELFGGREQQQALGVKLFLAFPPRCRAVFHNPFVLREAHLAQPSTSAVVEYLHGGVADVAKGGVA